METIYYSPSQDRFVRTRSTVEFANCDSHDIEQTRIFYPHSSLYGLHVFEENGRFRFTNPEPRIERNVLKPEELDDPSNIRCRWNCDRTNQWGL